MKKRIFCFLLTILMLGSYVSAAAAAASGSSYTDVPSNHWAASEISQATQLGIIKGIGDGRFGLGQSVTRAQFATMLVRLFNWALVTPSTPSFSDNTNQNAWYYSEIETAVANGAVRKDTSLFRPNDIITREDMAVMLVRALGYDTLATSVAGYGLPFTDVTQNVGYITMAYNFGITNGTTGTTFEPSGSATREQAVAMMIRLYDKYNAKINWLHAFYAISSASQMSCIPDFSAISLGWSRLEYTAAGDVSLNTSSSGGNSFSFPSGYLSVTQTAQNSGVSTNLDVYMSTAQTLTKSDGTVSNACREILLSSANRSAAIAQIMTQLQNNAFLSGVTIDFEGMSGSDLKAGLSSFIQDLRTATDNMGKTLYVCVPPVTSDGQYYNAYDYRTLATYSDKIILMAHDYEATSMPANLMSAGFTTTPLTPIQEIYYALKAITDPNTGVQDLKKVALAISFNTAQWQLQNNIVINAAPYHPDTSSVYSRLINAETTIHYSTQYQNPYATFYNDSNGTQNVIWYEDERSVLAKVDLARMFGVTGISVWRLGLIPNYTNSAGQDIHFNVLNVLLNEK